MKFKKILEKQRFTEKIELFWYNPAKEEDNPNKNKNFNWDKHALTGNIKDSTIYLNWENNNSEFGFYDKNDEPILIGFKASNYDREKLEKKIRTYI